MLILASASPRRQALLQGLGLSFETRPQHCAEHSAAKDPADFVAVNKRIGGYQFYPVAATDLASMYITE